MTREAEATRSAPLRSPAAGARRELELDLLHNVEFARALYDELRLDLKRNRELAAAALTHDRDVLSGRCRQLHDAVQLALGQYRDALHRFTQLVIHHKLPE